MVVVGLSYVQGLAAEVIKVGVVMNLTGPWASIDEPAWKGIQLAVKEINDAGGLLGKKVEAKAIDTKADEAETVGAVIRLIESEKASAIIGYCDTHWVLTGAPIAREYGIPFITPGATHPRIPERTGAWLAPFGDNAQAAAIAEYAYEDLGLRKVAVWVDTACDFSVAVCAYFVDAFKYYGGTVVYEDYFEIDWTDFSALVTRLKAKQDAKEVDSVYIGAIPGNVGLIVKQLREGGVTVPILGEDGFDTPLLAEVGGEHAEGVIFATHVSLESPEPRVVRFVKAYEEMWGIKPENAFAALGYDAMNLLAKAIETIKSAEPRKISAGLTLIRELPGATGTISYPVGSKVPNKSVAVLVVKEGKFSTIKEVTPKYLSSPEIAR
jgi:branched-chain amino acid transport system substrate-binding protein